MKLGDIVVIPMTSSQGAGFKRGILVEIADNPADIAKLVDSPQLGFLFSESPRQVAKVLVAGKLEVSWLHHVCEFNDGDSQ